MRTLLLLAFLLATQAAHAFYDSSKGRWIARDPVGEEGGINVNGFVGGDAVSRIDVLGLAEVGKDKDGRTVVSVEKCEIVLHVGHGNPKDDPFFDMPPKSSGCPSGAGFIGCYADQINRGIIRRGILIPGAPLAGGEDTLWKGKVSPRLNEPDWNEAIRKSLEGVKELVNDWLKNKTKCCTSVKVTVVGANGKSNSQTFSAPIVSFEWPKGPAQ